MAHQTAARKADSNRAAVRTLLGRWQSLNSRQHVLLDEMAGIEAQLSEHINLMKPVDDGCVCGPFADVCLDVNAVPPDRAAWLNQSLAAAGL